MSEFTEYDRGYQDGNMGRDKGQYFASAQDRWNYIDGWIKGNDDRIAYGYGNSGPR